MKAKLVFCFYLMINEYSQVSSCINKIKFFLTISLRAYHILVYLIILDFTSKNNVFKKSKLIRSDMAL